MSTGRERFAIFGKRDPRQWVPEEGVCLSSFVMVKKGKGVLMGKVGDEQMWKDRWCLPLKEERWKGKWLLPACHLKMGEHPEDAAKRIMKEMLAIESFDLKFLEVQSHVGDTGHWDVCFIYEAEVKEGVKTPAWYSELAFLDPSGLKPEEFGRGHGDILKELWSA